MTDTIRGSGVQLLDNPGFRYGMRSWTYNKPSVAGGGIASAASDTLADGDVDPGPVRFPSDYVADAAFGTDALHLTGTWQVAPTRSPGKIAGTVRGPGTTAAWFAQGNQWRTGERVTVRAAMRNSVGGGTPLGRLEVYPVDQNLVRVPGWDPSSLDGALVEAHLGDDGVPVRFDTQVLLPSHPLSGNSGSWVVAFGLTTSAIPADFDQGWELVEAQGELAPLAGQSFVVGPVFPNGQAAPLAYGSLVHTRVPVLEGSTYYARGLVWQRRDETKLWVSVALYDAHGVGGRTLDAAVTGVHPGGPSAEGWALATLSFVVQPGEAFAAFLFQYQTPDQVAVPWRLGFDQAGLYEGAMPDAWEVSGDGDDVALDYPKVALGGMDYTGLVRSASWKLGRSWWMVGPEAGTASLELQGDRQEIVPGVPVVIAGSADLFHGVVDDVLVQERPGEPPTSRVEVVDATSWLARPKIAGTNAPPEAFAARMVTIYGKAGATITTRTMPAESAVPDPAHGPVGSASQPVGLLEYLATLEAQANAITQLGPDGVLRILHRVALPSSGVPSPVYLEGEDCPYQAQLDRQSVGKVVNLWRFTNAEEPWTTAVPEGGTSASRYGVREYDTKLAQADKARYPDTMRAVLANASAMPSWTVGVRITRRGSPVAGLGPFDFVSWRGKVYQVLELSWSAAPDSWTVQLHLDATQTAIAGKPDVPPPPPVYRKRATLTVTANADGYAVRTSGGLNAGNGASGNVLVGRLADGHLCRAFLGFPTQTFLGTNRRVVSAELRVTTNRGGCMTWGSSPKVLVQRVVGTWSQGSHATACSFTTSNALHYPGPDRTSSGQVTSTIPAADSRLVKIRIDAIAQAWLDGSAQRGVALLGASESSSANRAAFDASGSGRAQLVLTYEYDSPTP